MAHINWCGERCADCTKICGLDESMPCSPDCENLSPDGIPNTVECQKCDAFELF